MPYPDQNPARPDQSPRDPDRNLAELEKVLAALRTREAPAGMEDRILASLARAAAEPRAHRARNLLSFFRIAPATAATAHRVAEPNSFRAHNLLWFSRVLPAAAALCALLLVAFPHHHAAPRAPAMSVTAKPHLAKPAISQPAHPTSTMRLETLAKIEKPPAHPEKPQLLKPAILAASHPPPPLPLTPQEQLLVQLARSRGAAARPLLDPALQNQELARLDQEFERFFTPPTPAPQPQPNPESSGDSQ